MSKVVTCQDRCFRFYLQVSVSIHTEKNITTWNQIGLFLLLQVCILKLSMRAASMFCVKVGKWPKKYFRVTRIHQNFPFAQREVQMWVYVHAPGTLSALQSSTKVQKALAAVRLSPTLLWADTGKSSTAQPDPC